MTIICWRSVQAIAFAPPAVVYETATPPMMSVVIQSGQPRMTVRTTAGAYSVMPSASPRCSRKITLTSARTRVEPLLQVFVRRIDFRARKSGTAVNARITIAIGRPK